MKAMVLRSLRPAEALPLTLEEVPLPEPGPGEVRVKVAYCGVCRTDLHIAEGDLLPPRLPLILGHQVVGVVDAVGDAGSESEEESRDGSQGLQGLHGLLGARVGIPWLHGTCGECRYCRAGQENLCEGAVFTGFSADGGYAEYAVARADYLVRLPEGFPDVQAAPLLCAGIIGYRSIRVAGVLPGETVGLFGFGASAHLAIQILRHWGCDVLVYTRGREHQELARELGASWAGRAEEGREGVLDRAITFAPSGALVPAALRALRRGGTLAINAVHMDPIPPLEYPLIYWEKKIVTVANSTRSDAAEFIALAAEIPLRVKFQIYPLEEANQALLDLKRGKVQGEAVLEVSSHVV